MNYIKLINAFYDRLETNSLSTSAIALWHALVHVNNKAGWQREFTVAVSVLCVKSGLSERTITNARNDLKVKGYLDFRSRKGSKSAVYILSDLSATITDKFTDSEPLSAINADNLSCNVSDNASYNVSDNLSALNKLNKTKQNETNTAAAALNFFDTYHLCFNRIPNAIQVEEIKSFIDHDGISDDVVCAAFKKASENGAGYPYARSIILSWIKKGIKTIADVEKEQASFEQKKQQQRNKRQGFGPTRKEILPDWYYENNKTQPAQVETAATDDGDFEEKKRLLQEKIKKLRS